jgi:lipopolysaccharide export system ATP-binding protein
MSIPLSGRTAKHRKHAGHAKITEFSFRPLVLCGVLFWIALFTSNANAQLKLHDFKFAIPFEQTNAPAIRNRPKTLFTAGQARTLSNDFYRAEVVMIENYQQDGKTNLIIRAPDCLFDATKNTASSTNRLELESPSGLHVEGMGFVSYLTNFNIIISNDVRTSIRQQLLQSAPEIVGVGRQTNQTVGTNIGMTIRADRLVLNYPSNLLTYVGHVRVEHFQLVLECASLIVQRTTNGSLEHVIAQNEVRIVNKSDGSEAHGDSAIYTMEPLEIIKLSGRASWNDDQRKSRADLFVLDPKQRHLQAQGDAWMSLPRQGITQPQVGLPKSTKIPTNALVEITADRLDVQMPTTNQPYRTLKADRHVVIVSPADQSRATANSAIFDERTGVAEFTGDAIWEAGDRMARGQILRYDRTNHTFHAQRNAYLKMPIAALASVATPITPPKKQTKATNAAPQFVEVYSNDYTYTSNSLVFRDNVRGQVLEGQTPRGRIECAMLALRFTNRLETVSATGHAKLEQLPWLSPSGKKTAKKLNCEQLFIRMQSAGIVEQITAKSNVFAEQQEWRASTNRPIHSVFTADNVVADFFRGTNQVREALADGHVSVLQESRIANGDRALYDGATDTVQLIGHPAAEFPEGKITDDEMLTWNRAKNKIFGHKLKGEGEVRRTNQSFFIPSASTQPMNQMSLISTNKLVKAYKQRRVVNGVSIEVAPGEVVGLLGPNGAGKTTTFNMVVGVVKPDDGTVSFHNYDVTTLPMHQRARLGMGYLTQEPSVFRKLTVEQNILAILETCRMSRSERHLRLKYLLDELDLARLAKSKAYMLSGGEKRRLEITRALVTSPKLLLLDEPFSGIDPIAVYEVQKIVRRLKERGLGILITDHNVRETLKLVDRAYLIFQGEVVYEGRGEDLPNDPKAREIYLGPEFNM